DGGRGRAGRRPVSRTGRRNGIGCAANPSGTRSTRAVVTNRDFGTGGAAAAPGEPAANSGRRERSASRGSPTPPREVSAPAPRGGERARPRRAPAPLSEGD